MAKDKDYQPPPSWAELLGDEDLSVYQPQDQPAPPGPQVVGHAHRPGPARGRP
jgi:hypothetical protein